MRNQAAHINLEQIDISIIIALELFSLNFIFYKNRSLDNFILTPSFYF